MLLGYSERHFENKSFQQQCSPLFNEMLSQEKKYFVGKCSSRTQLSLNKSVCFGRSSTHRSWINQLVLSTPEMISWPLTLHRGRACSLQMPSIYSDTERGRGRTGAVSNSSLDVGYRVGSAAEQDQIADILRKWETRGRGETINCPWL